VARDFGLDFVFIDPAPLALDRAPVNAVLASRAA
jgi:hypothetical protein